MKFIEESLRKRPTYDEVIDYIENKQPKIKYPDRTATFLRNSPYLSQFDGDSWIDLETQENNIEREKMKEAEVKRISRATGETAQLIRASTQTDTARPEITDKAAGVRGRNKGIQAARTIYAAEAGTNTAIFNEGGTQTDPITTRKQKVSTTTFSEGGTQTDQTQTSKQTKRGSTTQIFDMTVDDIMDDEMEETDAILKQAKEEDEKKKKVIYDKVSKHLGEQVRDLPYLRPSTSSSSQVKKQEPAENTSRPRGRPPLKDKPINDESENTTQPRGRKPMIVNNEGEQSKRKTTSEPKIQPPKKKITKKQADKELRALENAANIEPKAKAKSKAKASNVKSDDDDVEVDSIKPNRSTKIRYWKEQSANELRAQLKLRDLKKFQDEWAFKSKDQLLDIIRDLIKSKKW